MPENIGSLSSKDYVLKTLRLISSTGDSVDISSIFMELEIYQDLYASVMHGDVVINDGADHFNNFNFCGNEYLQISIDQPGLGLPLEKLFRIYKTSDRKPSKDNAQVYVLHFCSEEMILSNSMRISKSYKGMKASDIIKDVLINSLKVGADRINSFDETAGQYDFVVPYYRPLEIIQWAVGRSYSLDPKYCYFFYENSAGYNFQSLQTLYKQKPYKKLKFDIKTIDSDPSTNKDSPDKFTIVNDFDVLQSMSNGSYASRLLAVDVFSQSYKEYKYSLADAASQGRLLNSAMAVNEFKNSNSETNMTAYNTYFNTYVEINDTSSERENSVDKWMQPRALHMANINAFKFSAILPGDIAMKVGDIVEFDFSKFVGANKSGKEKDEFRTAKYLVTAINHKFREDVFETIAEFAADSFATAIPTAKDLTSLTTKKA